MNCKVTIEITDGELAGQRFEFEEHDLFLFGRHSDDCHAALPNDSFASRHHFILEVNPPNARLRDLGSLNGTFVNGNKHGGRRPNEKPEEGQKRSYPEVDLKTGDEIRVGHTKMRLMVQEGTAQQSPQSSTVIMSDADQQDDAIQQVVTCQQCRQNVTEEIGAGREGEYVCDACREQLADSPLPHLQKLLHSAVKMVRPQSADESPSAEVTNYMMQQELGRGGMGVVYLGTHQETKQNVAIKMMLPKVAVSAHARKIFQRECHVLCQLNHPHIVNIIETGSAGNTFYFMMDYCNGGSLSDLQADGQGVSVQKSVLLTLQVLKGLAFAHQQGYVHRDIKPQNILLHTENGKTKARLADFGLAKNFEQVGFSGMTATGSVSGTLRFMAREQLTNFKYTEPVSDIWSLGASLYWALTGETPRHINEGQHPTDAILKGQIVPIQKRNPNISTNLASVIDKAVADDHTQRFQTANEMHAALCDLIDPKK